ncbi:LysR substrate-binding domain-containing protein [Testudinibacter sp. P80/BLE/0925]|uniref:LysR family transcriptional regulator n=1 Tax=Testudinibacter sp. TW-1 TaxID=3417757 RepID=UPI003D36758A
MNQLPDFEAWAIFAKVVETGSFSAAAQALQLSQATVSKAISRLESRMNTTLLQRTSRKLTLTESGLAVQEYAKALLAQGIGLEAQLRAEVNQLQGKVRFALPMSFGLLQVAPLLAEFSARYPEIELDLHFADEQQDLIEAHFDFALRIAKLDDSSYRARRLCCVARLLVGAPAYFARNGSLRHPKDLPAHRTLVYNNVKNVCSWTFYHATQGKFTQLVEPTLQANNAEAFLPALLAGQGVAIMPEFMVRTALRQGQLQQILDDWTIEPLSLYLLAPPSPLRPKRVQLLMDFLSERLSDHA